MTDIVGGRSGPGRWRGLLLAGALALAGCGATGPSGDQATPPPSSSAASSATPPPTTRPSTSASASATAAPRTGTKITSGASDFGSMLFDDAGQAIYIWELETTGEAKCYGDCATAWPPVLTEGPPSASGDIETDKLGTINRRDGSVQVTYKDHPLYYYAHEGPGQVKCHNIRTHGGLWWVITPGGDRAP